MENKELTEFSKKREYEEKMTDELIATFKVLEGVGNDPTYQNLRTGWNRVVTFAELNIKNSYYMAKYLERVKPVMDDIEIILFGSLQTKDIYVKMKKYGVLVQTQKGNVVVHNPQKIVHELREIANWLMQIGYSQGLYLQKPYDRKFGNEAISDVMEM